jgi:hypothetical protein
MKRLFLAAPLAAVAAPASSSSRSCGMSLTTVVAVLLVWTLVAQLVGAWRETSRTG